MNITLFYKLVADLTVPLKITPPVPAQIYLAKYENADTGMLVIAVALAVVLVLGVMVWRYFQKRLNDRRERLPMPQMPKVEGAPQVPLICVKCGAILPGDAMVCNKCGTRQLPEEIEETCLQFGYYRHNDWFTVLEIVLGIWGCHIVDRLSHRWLDSRWGLLLVRLGHALAEDVRDMLQGLVKAACREYMMVIDRPNISVRTWGTESQFAANIWCLIWWNEEPAHVEIMKEYVCQTLARHRYVPTAQDCSVWQTPERHHGIRGHPWIVAERLPYDGGS